MGNMPVSAKMIVQALKRFVELLSMVVDGNVPYDLMMSTVQALIERKMVEPTGLRQDEYRVQVESYVVAALDVLKTMFDWVWDSHGAANWEEHASRKDASVEPGERIFLVKQFKHAMTSDAAIAWGEENGYFVANRAEAIAFAKANPELQRQFWIAALGSSVLWHGCRGVAVLHGGSGGRSLGYDRFASDWYASYRFLFVRK